MSLQKADSRRSNVPKNAVLLNEGEACSFQWKKITDWPNKWDVWAFKYGIGSLAGAAGFTALSVNRYYRRKLKLHGFGYLSTLFSTIVASTVATGFVHLEFITKNLLIQKTPCSICLQTKAALLQIGTGVVYPTIVAPILCSMVAIKTGTRIPYYTEVGELWKMWSGYSKPLIRPLLLTISLHSILAVGITYLEGQQLYNLQEKCLSYEANKPQKQN